MQAWLDWLSSLPAPWLYGAIVVAACAENVFPPLPADSVVALGAFAAARSGGSALGAWAATMVGNLVGALAMFALGRRVGISGLSARFPRTFPAEASARVAAQFRKRGLLALIVSRFLPGVRALVPPVAGALGMGVARSAAAMAIASGVWYAIVCGLAFRAGANADALLKQIASQQRLAGAVAAGIILLVAAAFAWRRRNRR